MHSEANNNMVMIQSCLTANVLDINAVTDSCDWITWLYNI